jgi:hypothetical protein
MAKNHRDNSCCKTTAIIKTYAKRLRLLKVNRELLVFSVFLGISIVFWFLQAFQENTTLKVEQKLDITNIPENIQIISEIPENIGVTISGRCYDVLVYAINNKDKEIIVNYNDFKADSTSLTIDNNRWKRILSDKFTNNVKFDSATSISLTTKSIPVTHPK